MPRPPTGRREQILEEARVLFTTNGYDATPVGEIAQQLEISKAAVAYYFPAKDDLITALAEEFLDDLERATVTSTDASAALGGYLDTIIDHHDIACWLDTDPAITGRPEHERLATINERVIKLIVGSSRRKADRLRALSVLGGVWRPAREATPAELAAHRDELIDAALASYIDVTPTRPTRGS